MQFTYIVTIIAFMSCNQAKESNEQPVDPKITTVNEQPKPAAYAPADKNKISGSWTRTDAPYNLKIGEFSDDGTMKAEYFNPKPIHVGKATWSVASGIINIHVELRDENYPGSNYTLYYVADKDLLAGKYFQAVEGVTYDVAFIRSK